MLGNRCGDFFILAAMCRIIAAHNALQFGKLAHHIGNQIRFGQFCCPPRNFRVGCLHLRGDYFSQPGYAPGLVSHATQPFIKGDFCQTACHLRQWLASILIPEKTRIGQARAQYPLITGRYQLVGFGIGLAVSHSHKIGS